MCGVGVAAAPGVPGGDPDAGQQRGDKLTQGGQRTITVAVVIPRAYSGRAGQPLIHRRVRASFDVKMPVRVADRRDHVQVRELRMLDGALDTWHPSQLGSLLLIHLSHGVDLGPGSQRHQSRQQLRPGSERAIRDNRRPGADLAAVFEPRFHPAAGDTEGLDGPRNDRSSARARRPEAECDVAARAEVTSIRLAKNRFAGIECCHRETGVRFAGGQDRDVRAMLFTEPRSDAKVSAVAGGRGQDPAADDQVRVEFSDADAGEPVQLRPYGVPAEVPDDPALIIMRAVARGAVRGCRGADHRDGSVRSQIPGRGRAEHPVSDNQEVHKRIIPRDSVLTGFAGYLARYAWTGLVLIAGTDHFSELKRSRDRKPSFG